MSPELEDKLYKLSPIFFKHAIACKEGKETMRDTCMYFGCECGDGWYKPIETLAKCMQEVNEHFSQKYGIVAVADQIKEKFADFNCYRSIEKVDGTKGGYDAEQTDAHKLLWLISRALVMQCEHDCKELCEHCGANHWDSNLVYTKGWVKRYCTDCCEKLHKEYDKEVK